MNETEVQLIKGKMEIKRVLEEAYPHKEARLKRIECVYIPVTNAVVTKQFFMKHQLITLTKQGNPRLASGQGIFFLETREPFTSNFITHAWDDDNENHVMEGFCFEVENIHELYEEMKESGAVVREMKDFGGCGMGFIFQDPDGNKYDAWQRPGK